MAKFLISVTLVVLSFHAIAQNSCPIIEKIYATDSLGIESEKIKLPLFFLIRNDSIIVSLDFDGESRFMEFKILNKSCQWNSDTSVGFTFFKLAFADEGQVKHPTLAIHTKAVNNRYIELLHENSEKRIFTIRKQKLQN